MSFSKALFLLGCVCVSALAADARAPMVSMVQLLADPARFDAHRVAVAGFLSLELEGSALYLHAEDFEHHMTKNALWVLIPKSLAKGECFDRKHVVVVGTVKSDYLGHMGAYSGSIEVETVFSSGPPQPGCA